jgi:hypothetical protein
MTNRPQKPCTARGCHTETSSSDGKCWEHRPAPEVRRDGNRIIVGRAPLILSADTALTLAHRLADILAEDRIVHTTRSTGGIR